MVFYLRGVELRFSFWFFAVLALFLLMEEGAPAFYLLLPVAVHELGHLAVMGACRVRVRGVTFTAFGVNIRRACGPIIGYGKEIAVCLGGPAANLLWATLLHATRFHSMRLMLLVAANIAVAIFNLAPVGNLDGGQVLRLSTARLFPPEAARWISRTASVAMLALLVGFALFLLMIRRANLSLLVCCGYLAVVILTQD